MADVVSQNIRNRVGDLTLQTFGTGPFGTLTPTASGGVVTIPSGYQIIFAVGGGEARIAQIQQGVDVAASNNDVVYAVIDGQEITAIEAAASAPAGSQILGTATGTPVDTFTQNDRAGGLVTSDTGDAAKLFATITMSATQPSTRLNAGDHFELDTIFQESSSSGITVTSGGGDQTDGLVTLPQGHVFKVSGYLNATFNASTVFAIHAIRNNTSALIVSPDARTFTRNANNSDSHVPIAFIDTEGGAQEIEWRIISETGLLQAIGAATALGDTYLVVEEK